MAEPALVIGLGEVLWDMLPSGKVLGGAPANFAYMINILGDKGVVASRVGSDQLGREAYREMEELGLDISYVQQDELRETGTANVSIDGVGQPTFTIKETVAWDFLQWTPSWQELAARADVICFGSLAQRSHVSASTIQRFLSDSPKNALRVFDVNLRQSFYDRDVLRKSLGSADIVKMNELEFREVSRVFGLGAGNDETLARTLLRQFDLKIVCITRGSRGSLLVSKDHLVDHMGFPVQVADAVGAGDAFAASVVHHYLRGYSLDVISESANRLASWVATQIGATPQITAAQIHQILGEAPNSGDECKRSAQSARKIRSL